MNIGFETETVEFKKSTGEIKEGIVSISSMLNKHGYGTLYFGVKNNGDIIGQEIGDLTLRDVSHAIANHIKPQLIPSISLEYMDGKNVIKVTVTGNEKPYSAYGKYYIRVADEDRELSPEQLKKIMIESEDADAIVRKVSTSQNLSFAQLKNAFSMNGLTINNNSFENNLSLKNLDSKYNLMSELLADKNDISIKVVTFKGKDKSTIIKRNEYGFKCLLIAMDQVLSYVESLNETDVILGTHQRTETPLFDFACFKEAWQNACLHNSWITLNPPAVYIYSDRIEIISTGGLPAGLTREEFFKGISKPVNIKLQKIFGQLGYVEQTGHGVPQIVSHYGMQAFEIMENFICVTIPFNKSFRQTEIFDEDSNPLTAEAKILKIIKSNPAVKIPNIVAITGLSDSYTRKIIKRLKDSNRIERVGSNKTGIWKILD